MQLHHCDGIFCLLKSRQQRSQKMWQNHNNVTVTLLVFLSSPTIFYLNHSKIHHTYLSMWESAIFLWYKSKIYLWFMFAYKKNWRAQYSWIETVLLSKVCVLLQRMNPITAPQIEKALTRTWFEHATFWSGVRRATIAPPSHTYYGIVFWCDHKILILTW